MNNHLLTVLFLILAIVLYLVGMVLPATIFLALGGIAEVVFWVRLFNPGRHNSER